MVETARETGMLHKILPLALIFAAMAAHAQAQSAPGTPAAAPPQYEQLAFAEAVDESCGFLPYIEHEVLSDLAYAAVDSSPMASAAAKNGDSDAVSDFYKAQEAKAKSTPCTEQAGQGIIVPVRGEIAMELAIAVATANLRYQKANTAPSMDNLFSATYYSAPDDDTMRSAQMVDGYLQQLWGASYATLAPRALATAQSRMDADLEDQDSRWSRYLYGVDYQARAQRDGAALVAGPHPWQRYRTPDGKVALTQRTASFGKFGSAFVYLAVRDGQVSASSLEIHKDTFDALTGIRLYIRKPDAPATKNDLPLLWDASWRANARGFDMTATADRMFGGTVYRLPQAGLDALKALPPDDEVEIAVVTGDYDGTDMAGTSRARFTVKDILSGLTP
jgi:hypothetical protein